MIAEVVKSIGDVGLLTTEQLVELSRKLFQLISFCDCQTDLSDTIKHTCDRSNYYDYLHHSPMCKCCQQRIFLNILGRCMEKLADDDRLPEFEEAHLSSARIRDRTYGHIRIGSELIFRIVRHLDAWRNESKMREIVQNWDFDFEDLRLDALAYDESTIGISVRRLMESRSKWIGKTTELLIELKKVHEELTYTRWGLLNSPYELNQTLQELKTYLEEFGISIERRRYARTIRIHKM